MRKTRIDRFKIKREMDRLHIGAFQDLADLADLSQTTLYAVLDSYSWRAATLDALANALGTLSTALLTVDEVDEPANHEPANHEPAATPSPPTSATTARQKQREALSTAALSPAEAERRAALLAQAAGAQARRG